MAKIYLARRARVRAAFFAAVERLRAPLVRTALRAAFERSLAVRLRAAVRACLATAFVEAAECLSCARTRETARDRFRDGRCCVPCSLAAVSCAALRFVARDEPAPGGGSFTPARRALDNPP